MFFSTRFAVFLAAERATPTGPIFLNDSAASADAAAASMPSLAASAASAPYLQGLLDTRGVNSQQYAVITSSGPSFISLAATPVLYHIGAAIPGAGEDGASGFLQRGPDGPHADGRRMRHL